MNNVNFTLLAGSAIASMFLIQGCQTVSSNSSHQALYPRDGEIKTVPAEEVGTPGTYREVVIPPGETVEGPGGLYAAPAPLRTATVHTVVKGDSISEIAKTYSVSQRAIISLNGLSNPNKLRIGQKINIPEEKYFKAPAPVKVPEQKIPVGAKIHTVAKGESVSVIAKNYGIRTADVLNANKLERYSVIKVGQKLVIPATSATADVGSPSAPAVTLKKEVKTAPVKKPEVKPIEAPKVPVKQAEVAVPPLPPAPSVPAPSVALPPPPAPTAAAPSVAPVPVKQVEVIAPPPPAPPKSANTVTAGTVATTAGSSNGRKITSYRVRENEDVYTVALRWETSPSVIRQLNNMSSDDLTEGQILKVPAKD